MLVWPAVRIMSGAGDSAATHFEPSARVSSPVLQAGGFQLEGKWGACDILTPSPLGSPSAARVPSCLGACRRCKPRRRPLLLECLADNALLELDLAVLQKLGRRLCCADVARAFGRSSCQRCSAPLAQVFRRARS